MIRARAAARSAGLVAALLAAGACGGGTPAPKPPGPSLGDDAAIPPGPDDGLGADPAGRDEAPLEERIAAVERGMNELAPVASQCWAAGAADDFHLAGDVRLLVSVDGAGKARAEVSADTTGDAVLTRCLVAVAEAYAWAPPLRGEAVELPFHFDAPRMQNVIDRRFVPRKAQAGVELAVLLDQLNAGNPAASVLEVRLAAGARSGPREVERTELWIFLAPATVEPVGGRARAVAAGDVVLAPVGTRLSLAAGTAAASAVVAIVPGGREGTARAGALPGRATTDAVTARPVQPVFVEASKARRYPRTGGATTILVEPPLAAGALSAGRLEIDAGVKVPLHTHGKETELLYLLSGAGTMTVAGVDVPVGEHAVVQIPAGVEHAFAATAATTALQLYTPAGPEQRFKTMK